MRLLDNIMEYVLEVIESFRESGYFKDLELDEETFLQRVLAKCKRKVVNGEDYHFSDEEITELIREGVEIETDNMIMKFMDMGIVEVKATKEGEIIYVANDKTPKQQ